MTRKKTKTAPAGKKPCVRCQAPFAFAELGVACRHFVEGRLRSYTTSPGDSAFPDTSCTLCDFAEGAELCLLCHRCWQALCRANVWVDAQARERGYALASREPAFEVLSIHRPGRCAVEKGASVKLGFTRVPTAEDRWFEQMWVEVTGEGTGVLDNEPVLFDAQVLREGSVVSFTDDQVLHCLFRDTLVELPAARRREPPREPDDDGDRRCLADVSTYGWHVIHVSESETSEPFAFTIGLHHSFGHPEVMVRGLEIDVAHAVLTRIGNGARDGRADGPRTDLLHGATCTSVPFPKDQYRDFLGYACWFYQGLDFPAVELCWRGETAPTPSPR